MTKREGEETGNPPLGSATSDDKQWADLAAEARADWAKENPFDEPSTTEGERGKLRVELRGAIRDACSYRIFQRTDSDGVLIDWADDLTRRMESLLAEPQEQGERAEGGGA